MNQLSFSKIIRFFFILFILNEFSNVDVFGLELTGQKELNPGINKSNFLSQINNKTSNDSLLLKIDFGPNTSSIQQDFKAYLADHENAGSFLPQSFLVAGNSVAVDVEWPAGTVNTVMQMIDRGVSSNSEMDDLLRDWIGTDGRIAKVPLVLTISNLPPGEYEWISYHHDNNDQTGIFNIKIEDTDGVREQNGIDISNGLVPFQNVTFFKTQIRSNGNDIKFTFEMDSYPDNSSSFFVLNGFSIGFPENIIPDTTLIPEEVHLISPLNNFQNVSLNTVLKWSKSEAADAYNIYLDTENPPKLLTTVKDIDFFATTLTANSTYYWSVEATNKNGKVKSEIRNFTTIDISSVDFSEETEVVFSHKRSFYSESFELKLTSNNPAANIIYTIDSSTPAIENGLVYRDGIFIDSTLIIKAVAISDSDTSSVVTNTYLFPETIAKQGKAPSGFPTFWGGSSVIQADYEMDQEIVNHPDYKSEITTALQSIPSVSLTMDVDEWFNPNTGLYVGYPNSNISREKPVTAEFLFNDPVENFSVECGIQNQGGTSIVNWKVPKQSMRLLFKEMYGPTKLNYKLFPDSDIKSINTLVLDGFLYSWVHPFDEKQRKTSLFFRDQLASDMQNKMGWPSFHGIYVNLFINGLYWGMYDLHERPDEDFLEEYLDADKEEFEIIKHNTKTVVQGSNAGYLEMLGLARNGLISHVPFMDIQKYLDLPAFIDYMILNFYLGNYDWAHQNYYAARNKTQNTGFRFYTWDAEHVMRYSDVNYYNLQKNDEGGPTEIHSMLKQNKEYRMMFADAVYKHFFNDGVLTPESFEEGFLFRKNETEKAVILESARWGDYRKDLSGGVTYTKNDYWIPEVNKVLEDYIPRRRDIVIGQMRSENPRLFPMNMPPVFIGNQTSGAQMIELRNPNKEDGDIYYTIDGSDPRKVGGDIHGLKYTKAFSIENSSIIKARFLPKNSSEWSALAEKSFVFHKIYGQEVVINEIMYHPENNYPEFIELVNTGEASVILEGFVFSKGIEFNFQAGSNLFPGMGLVLTNDTALFKITYGFSAFGQYSKRLNNGGETLILENRFHQIVDSVSYSDTIPWPVLADGDGYSLELIDQKTDNSLYNNWKISKIRQGTPFEAISKQHYEAVLYPNPFTNKFYIEIESPELLYESFIVELFNLYGGKVKSFEAISNNLKIQIPAENLSRGVYVIKIKTKRNSGFAEQNFKALKL